MRRSLVVVSYFRIELHIWKRKIRVRIQFLFLTKVKMKTNDDKKKREKEFFSFLEKVSQVKTFNNFRW